MPQTAILARAPALDESQVLSKAVRRIAANWRITDQRLGAILGLSTSSAHRLKAGTFALERGSKAFELGQYLVRLFRSLDALMGSDDEASVSWLTSHNVDLEARPIDMLRTIRGLAEVADYVDDFRAHV